MENRNTDRRSILRTGVIGVAASALASHSASFATTGSERLERALRKAKRSFPETLAFVSGMPKGGDIHNHLEGDIYDTQALRSAVSLGLNYDLNTDSFTDRTVGNGVVRSQDIETDDGLYLRFRDNFSILGTKRAGKSGREQFFSTFGRFQSSRIPLAEVVAGVQRRAAIEQISYVETIAPVVPSEWIERVSRKVADAWAKGLEHTLDVTQVMLESGEFQDAVSGRLDGWAPSTPSPVTIRYVGYALRFFPLVQFVVHAACAAAATKADKRIVGLNLVGPEDSVVANRDFHKQLEILDSLWQRYDKPNIALHAGEFTQNEVTVEELRGRIRQSIILGHALRIGHGVSIAWDDERGDTLTLMRQRRIPVEICLTSNETILGVSGSAHPINLYRGAGVPIVYGSDDEGITRSSLTSELAKAVFRYDLSYSELRSSIRNSLEYSFLDGTSLFTHDNGRIMRSGNGRPAQANPTPFPRGNASEKAVLQLKLERDLANFESRF